MIRPTRRRPGAATATPTERTQREKESKEQEAREDAKQEEVKAVQAVRKVFSKMNAANPETFDGLKKELKSLVESQKWKLGSQYDSIKTEADRLISHTQVRMEKASEERKEVENKKLETQARTEELQRLLAELTDLVDVAEAQADLLREAIAGITKEGLAAQNIKPTLGSIEELGAEAATASGACQDFIRKHKLLEPGDQAWVKVRPAVAKLQVRIHTASTSTKSLMQEAKSCHSFIVKRIAARRILEIEEEQINKYSSPTGYWNREAIESYARDVFKFELSTEALDRILSPEVLQGQPSFPSAQLHRVRALVGIERDRVRSAVLRAEREEREKKEAEARMAREKELAAVRTLLEAKLLEVRGGEDGLEAHESGIIKVEEKVKKLGVMMATATIEEVTTLLKELAEAHGPLSEAALKVHERTDALSEEKVEPELTIWFQTEVKKLRSRTERLKSRSTRAGMAMACSKETIDRKRSLEAEKLRASIVGCLRNYMLKQELVSDSVFLKMHGEEEGCITAEQFAEFMLDPCECEMSAEDLKKFFLHIEACNGTGLNMDGFANFLKTFNKVLESTVMTSGLSIKEGAVIRRVKVGEILEVLEGPRKEETVGLMRIKCMAIKDGITGWVTVVGNQGTTYLQEGGNIYKVIALDAELFCGDNPSKLVRKLKQGEVIEAFEWEKKKEEGKAETSVRIRGRAKVDGALGWTDASKLELL